MSKALVEATIAVATRYANLGVREQPPGSNSGPHITQWLKSVNLDAGNPYCMAAVWSWVQEAAEMVGEVNPLARVGSVQKLVRATVHGPLWTKTPKRGCVFLHLRPDGKGHTGIVIWANDGTPGSLTTVEANTNDAGSRDGDGVYEKTRPLDYANMGYVDLEAADPHTVVARNA